MDRVLIVDDDEDLLDMVCLMALSNGFSPYGVKSAEAAMAAIKNERFGLILMDIYLGDQDGRDLTRRLKEAEQYKDIPILLYSAGNITPGSITESKADGFLQKPFEMPELITRMRELIAA